MSGEDCNDSPRRMIEEENVRERIDASGVRWRKVYVGGGSHFRNWLEQCRELGDVDVEEIDPAGVRCYERSGEKLYRIWMKIPSGKEKH